MIDVFFLDKWLDIERPLNVKSIFIRCPVIAKSGQDKYQSKSNIIPTKISYRITTGVKLLAILRQYIGACK